MLFKVNSNTAENAFAIREVERQNVPYTDSSKRFYEVSRDFSKQYAHIYSARLNTYRNILGPIIKKKWSDRYKILKLCELREKGTTCVIIGTLFKLQKLKPSILKELSDQLEIIPQAPRTHFVHDSDSLVLEDELQRIKLVGESIDIHQVVTGVVCGLLGSEDEDGIFTIKDVCWAGSSIQKALPKLSADRYIVLVSGLNASNTADNMFSMHLFLEWLAGLSGTSEYQEEVSKIVRVIVAGGVFAYHSTQTGVNEAEFVSSVELMDTFAATVSGVTPLDLMPSSKDPTGIMLPQKPFHYCLFPKAVEYKSFNRVSNPYECDIGGFTCLGTSDTDPFIIYNCPAIYFCGNSEEFSTEIYKGDAGQQTRIVCVPNFCDTKTIALINLSNLECYSMKFS
ncbi:unnamed protein product [Arctia plantaginis]|uniref:DNA polymerase delta small subunit n=1 Tax=Arctia plantaginis TaxID=874455 RepID=A0A8S1BAL5_ARCPL|nr:unnamed protein product [Arctia plantaginis]